MTLTIKKTVLSLIIGIGFYGSTAHCMDNSKLSHASSTSLTSQHTEDVGGAAKNEEKRTSKRKRAIVQVHSSSKDQETAQSQLLNFDARGKRKKRRAAITAAVAIAKQTATINTKTNNHSDSDSDSGYESISDEYIEELERKEELAELKKECDELEKKKQEVKAKLDESMKLLAKDPGLEEMYLVYQKAQIFISDDEQNMDESGGNLSFADSTSSSSSSSSSPDVVQIPAEDFEEEAYSPGIVAPKATQASANKFICEECGISVKSKSSLTRHEKTHSSFKQFVCTQQGCKKSFREKASLDRHNRIHTGEKNYHCTVKNCGRTFADATNCRRHIESHEGGKPYKCLCGNGYSRRTTLKNHILGFKNDPSASEHREIKKSTTSG